MARRAFLDGLPADVVTARESLVVAVDRADAADLKTVGEWLAAPGPPGHADVGRARHRTASGAGHPARLPSPKPNSPSTTGRVVEALAAHCERLGVQWAPPVDDLSEAQADTVVIANGIDAPALWPGLPIRPVKGEVLRLRWRRGCMPVPQRVIRARVHGRQVYLVPRADGVVVGATQYEHGRDTAPAVTGVRELLDDACAVMPALGEYELAECAAGLRPMTPDGLPIVGRLDERTLVAAGHGRNGFLLAPWTAERDRGRTERCTGAERSGADESHRQRRSRRGRRADDRRGVAGQPRLPGEGHRGRGRLVGAAAIGVGDRADRRRAGGSGDGGAGWLSGGLRKRLIDSS